MKKYYLYLTVILIVLMLVNALVDIFLFKDISLVFNYGVIVVFSLITAVIHRWLLNVVKRDANNFPNMYMLSVIIKIFVYFVLAVVYALFDREHAKEFLLSYVIIYLVFLIFESSKLSKIARANPANVKNNGSDEESNK